ncbi:unnamed protein product [Ilex paraguariensis]|uniref:Disease resistance protein RGA3 n=1 Tax=Ilex paraguariensis TaxID=185542 RepID=A0ABC8USK1_9AQUA
MSTVKNVLQEAEERQVTNLAVRGWLERLKEIVYEVDNLVDEFAYEALRRKVEIHGSMRREVCNCFLHSNPFVFHFGMGKKTKDVRQRLDEIVAEANDFNFAIKVVEKQVQTRRRQETYSSVRIEVVGRESDKEAIIQISKSFNDDQNVHVIPILGMGGIGKTTLAQLVYSDNWVASEFSQRIWVHVSKDFDITGIVLKILNAVGVNECDKLAFEELQRRLQQKLRDRKFFLVLDDVWNEDRVEWIKLRDLLMVGARGSLIIVTTRSNKVASLMGTCSPHILKGLSDEDCLSVFVKWAFNEGDDRKHQNLVNIGREIVKKCGGVPLAARTFGGLLYLEFDVRDWMLARNNEIWAIVQNENDIMPVLRLSYDQMPSYLKQCFAYCSLLQKDEKIEKWRLIYLWMAQGFIPLSHHNKELGDIGERYISELVKRSFLQEEGQGYYKMHSLVHDLAQYVSSGECFTIKTITEPIPEIVKHAVFCLSLEDLKIVKSMNFRTILCSELSCNSYVQTIVSSFRYLRVLELNCLTGDVPSSIGELKHLRYLVVEATFHKITLPESISKLLNLQYLDLRMPCQLFFELPQGVGKLINLLCLSLVDTPLVCLPDEIGRLTTLQTLRISGSKLIKSLPEGIQHLCCLRYLEICSCNELTSLPSGMQYLTSLEELIIMRCQNLIFTENDFQGLKRLRSLTLYYLPKLINFPKRLQESAATLEHIRIVFCQNLTSLSDCLEYLTSLWKLELCFCPSVRPLPERTKCLTELTILQDGDDWYVINDFLEPFEGENVHRIVKVFLLEYKLMKIWNAKPNLKMY